MQQPFEYKTGSHDPHLLLRPDLGKQVYRLKIRVRMGEHPTREHFRKEALRQLEEARRQLELEGFELAGTPRLERGPLPVTRTATLNKPSRFSAREAIPGILQGNKYRLGMPSGVVTNPTLEDEYWEYEFSAPFVHTLILVDVPDIHEEIH